ncbi:hypothetical protein WMZ97_12140 [Lentibacillus sp. N15]
MQKGMHYPTRMFIHDTINEAYQQLLGVRYLDEKVDNEVQEKLMDALAGLKEMQRDMEDKRDKTL